MPAPLAKLLSAVTSGNNVLSPELVDHFGGREEILAALRSFDPNAMLTETETSGGEGGLGPMGLRLDFDVTKAPKSKMGTLGYDLRASNFGDLKNPHAVVDDENYGSVTNSANVKKPNDPLWVKLAPLLVSVAAPYAGGALAGMGIGGTAGASANAGTGAGATTAGMSSVSVKSITGELAGGFVDVGERSAVWTVPGLENRPESSAKGVMGASTTSQVSASSMVSAPLAPSAGAATGSTGAVADRALPFVAVAETGAGGAGGVDAGAVGGGVARAPGKGGAPNGARGTALIALSRPPFATSWLDERARAGSTGSVPGG